VTTAADLAATESLLPESPVRAVRTSAALMELGALVCTARAPRCHACPVAARCRWLSHGRPAPGGPPPRAQRYAGTDRQVRGLLMDVLRANHAPIPRSALDAVWGDGTQRERALGGLVRDGLAVEHPDGRFALPG
jgi:A/G-specific adenine glycosylase